MGALFLSLCVLPLSNTSAQTQPLPNDPIPVALPWSTASGPTFHRLTFDAGLFVTVGAGGTIATSINGTHWTLHDSGTTADLHAAIYGNDAWWVVGENGIVLTSPDAKHWSRVDTGISETLNDILYSRCLYVAVGTSGTVFLSYDGVHWSRKRTDTSRELKRILEVGDTFLAAGAHGTMLRSKDGSRWYPSRLGGSFGISDFFHAGDEVIALGCCGGGVLVGGVTGGWQSHSLPGSPLLLAGAFAQQRFVVVGTQGAIYTAEATPGPKMWLRSPSGTTRAFHDVAWGHGLWVAVGASGTIAVSTDGRKWHCLPGILDPTHP